MSGGARSAPARGARPAGSPPKRPAWLSVWISAGLAAGLALAVAAALGTAARGEPGRYLETPALAEAVAQGALPPVAARLPATPAVSEMLAAHREPGRHGGALRMIMGAAKDTRMMAVYGYARLVRYEARLQLVPDILERVDVEGQRVFTLHLREGHRWSDGHPFTAEDFRYYWEDVAHNKDLSPLGLPRALLVAGEAPRFDVLDRHTVRYAWPTPNPYFLPALAGPLPLYIYRPAHYLRQFHPRYADRQALARRVEEGNWRTWAGLHARMDNLYRLDNPELPVLQPWVNTTAPPSQRFVFERNPYFHRVDPAGRQLPYIDRVFIDIVDNKLVPAKTGAGESDLQARYLRFDNYTFLKAGEERNDYTVRLWRTAKGAQIALYPNLNAADPVWRRVLRDVRFRRALSLAIHRREVNQVVYYGLALGGNNTMLPESPLFRPRYRERWAQFDPERADALLDRMGLTERDARGIRLLPDGRPLEIIVESAGESTEETDVLELIGDRWRRVGVKLHTRPSQRAVFRNRIFSGKALMSVWQGLSNAVPTPNMSPHELAPTSQHQLQWPKWGQHYETGGSAGEPPELAAARALLALNRDWRLADTRAEREAIWHRMLEIHAERVFTIGVVAGVPQPVVVRNRLRNVPHDGLYNWDPGAYFGIHRPDTFWFAD